MKIPRDGHPWSRSKASPSAFTLVELLVVIGIIAVLISVLLPALGSARKQAGLVKCAAQLREIGMAFKLYELDQRGYWPVARINNFRNPVTGLVTRYRIDDTEYRTPEGGQGYWFNFLARYVTKVRMGNAVGTDASMALQSRQTIFFGCPEWEGYRVGGVTVGDINVVQPGFGMNIYPTFTDRPLTGGAIYPPTRDRAVHDPLNENPTGWFRKAKDWTRPAERMLLADSKFWLAQSGAAPSGTSWPPAVVNQPVLENNSAGYGDDTRETIIDIYRHGTYPKKLGTKYDARGGKIRFNILYCDGHVATTTGSAREAYRAIRMKFPG